ncbi:MAG: hypothetical protein A4E64_01871 [Syntrophorhabdus sp. PtaU1.Bin058]|nr:MAG: hypothetical protein A4E64_01871 [Syntrophorhabdus sp. PtaU1.Bin058]
MFIEVGPASLVITAERAGKTCDIDGKKVEDYIAAVLGDIRDYLPVLRQKAWKILRTAHMPEAAVKMIDAAKKVDEATLTPMAAVAGTVSEMVRDFIGDSLSDFVSVNNGGDIAVRNDTGREVIIGIGDIRTNRTTPYILKIRGLNTFGIATSGFGGRSLTLGLADIVTVIAENSAVADAAATFICNSVNIATDKVRRKKASEIDPSTDIPDELVTVLIGGLDEGEIREALNKGLTAAYRLKEKDVIYDVVLLLKERMVTTITGDKYIRLEVQDGD